MTWNSAYATLLSEKGLSLSERFGIADIALSRGDAIAGANLLLLAGCAILGGDVYFKYGERLEIASAAWSTDRDQGEAYEDFVVRAHKHTVKCITQFPGSPDHEALFSLVAVDETWVFWAQDGQ